VFIPPPGGLPEKPEMDGGPPAKRLKTEENLIPEGQFLARNPSPVTFKVQILFSLLLLWKYRQFQHFYSCINFITFATFCA
jgi:hypothetical protein